jgi:catechol 2,3-dioxygenase-like lactoylglutathione lyase family enzyme
MDADVGLVRIDHLTHNVRRGNMNTWAGFYEKLFNFREIRYFSIEGKETGLFSRALTSPCGKIRIAINESQDDNSQIEEYLNEYKGEGIQHIALGTDDIYRTVDALRARGIEFQDAPSTVLPRCDHARRGSSRNTGRAPAPQHFDRRQCGERYSFADVHQERNRSHILRNHSAQGERRVRRGEFSGAVRVDRIGPEAPRRDLIDAWPHVLARCAQRFSGPVELRGLAHI